jgi:hypothetical protein
METVKRRAIVTDPHEGVLRTLRKVRDKVGSELLIQLSKQVSQEGAQVAENAATVIEEQFSGPRGTAPGTPTTLNLSWC